MWSRKNLNFLYGIIFYLYTINALKKEGSECIDSTKGPGVCKRIVNCSLALDSMNRTGDPGLSSCGILGMDQLLCCPWSNATIRGQNDIIILNVPKDNDEDSRSSSEESVTVSGSKQFCEIIEQDLKTFPERKIAGGERAKHGQYPHMAALGYPDDMSSIEIKFKCGATIISKKFLLTAAHCIRTQDMIKPTLARIGVTNLNKEKPLDIKIIHTKVHFEYNRKRNHNDIGLLELEKEINFDEVIYPGCLYFEDVIPSSLVVTGWGATDNATESTNELMSATVKIEPNDKCHEYYSANQISKRNITDSQFCARYDTGDSCMGDSGGPIQLKKDNMYYIVGVISFGVKGCGKLDRPGVYTKVSKYIKWIDEEVYGKKN